jgi:integrase
MSTIRQRGDKWQAIVRVKKDGATVHQEARTFLSERLARDWADRLEAQIKRDGVPGRQLQVETLGGLILKYKATVSGVRPLRRSVEHELDSLAEWFKSQKLSGLTSETFARFAQERRKNGAGPATVQHNLSAVRTILNSAKTMYGLNIDAGMLREALQTLKRMGLVAASQKIDVRISQDTIDNLVREFQRIAPYPSTKIPMEAIVPLAVAFPRRRTELCEMLWANYDRKTRTIKLIDTKHPTQVRNETVPVPRAAAVILDTLPVIDARILPYKVESISASFERACDRLGITGVRLHDLRHEGISRLFEQGLDIPDVALISGHLSWTSLKRYTHLTPAKVLEKLDAHKQKAQEAPAQPT